MNTARLWYTGPVRSRGGTSLRAEELINILGTEGSIIVYSHFEKTRVNALANKYPDIATPLRSLVSRMYDLAAVIRKEFYHPAFHGSFSMMVNYDALDRYVKASGGSSCLAADSEGLKISLFGFGDDFDQLLETKAAYEEYASRFCTGEFLSVKNKIIAHTQNITDVEIISTCKMSRWDTKIIMTLAAPLLACLSEYDKLG